MDALLAADAACDAADAMLRLAACPTFDLPPGTSVLAFDTETTGLTGVVIQVGAVGLDAEGRELLSHAWLVRPPPGWRVERGAQRVHGISDEQLAREGLDAHDGLAAFARLATAANAAGVPLVAHNASFDVRALRRTLEAIGAAPVPLDATCTMQKSRAVAKKMFGATRAMKNAELYEALCGPVPADARLHDAVADARLTARAFLAGTAAGLF